MDNNQLAGWLVLFVMAAVVFIIMMRQLAAWLDDLLASRKFKINMVVGYGTRLVAGQKIDESSPFTVGLVIYRPDWRQVQLKLRDGQLVCVNVRHLTPVSRDECDVLLRDLYVLHPEVVRFEGQQAR